jgi:hypothetical protein
MGSGNRGKIRAMRLMNFTEPGSRLSRPTPEPKRSKKFNFTCGRDGNVLKWARKFLKYLILLFFEILLWGEVQLNFVYSYDIWSFPKLHFSVISDDYQSKIADFPK